MSDRPAPRDNEAGQTPVRPNLTPRPPLRAGDDVGEADIRAAQRLGVKSTPSLPRTGEGLGKALASTVQPSGPRSSPDKPIRVLIVDDSVLMRQAVRRLLGADPGI